MSRSITPAVLGLMIVNIAIHLAVMFVTDNQQWTDFQENYLRLYKVDTLGLHKYELPPGSPEFNVFQPLGSSFAHSPSGLYHILLNMMCLYFFGPPLERLMGSGRFLGLYFFCAIVGGFLGAFFDTVANPSLGASGAICGLLIAFAWLYPQSKMGLLFIPIFIPSRIFTAGFAAISFGLMIHSMSTGRSLGGISHSGHLAGMVAGFIFMLGFMALYKREPVVEEMMVEPLEEED